MRAFVGHLRAHPARRSLIDPEGKTTSSLFTFAPRPIEPNATSFTLEELQAAPDFSCRSRIRESWEPTLHILISTPRASLLTQYNYRNDAYTVTSRIMPRRPSPAVESHSKPAEHLSRAHLVRAPVTR